MWKIILTENPLGFNIGPLLKWFQMSFVYESKRITIRCMQRSRKWVLANWIGLYLPPLY